MTELLTDKPYGVKVTIISSMDYKDFREIVDAIEKLGYAIQVCDNGNVLCMAKEIKLYEVQDKV